MRHQDTLLDKLSRDRCEHWITAFTVNSTGPSCKRSVKIISPLIKPILYLPVRSDSTNISNMHIWPPGILQSDASPPPRNNSGRTRGKGGGKQEFPKTDQVYYTLLSCLIDPFHHRSFTHRINRCS